MNRIKIISSRVLYLRLTRPAATAEAALALEEDEALMMIGGGAVVELADSIVVAAVESIGETNIAVVLALVAAAVQPDLQ